MKIVEKREQLQQAEQQANRKRNIFETGKIYQNTTCKSSRTIILILILTGCINKEVLGLFRPSLFYILTIKKMVVLTSILLVIGFTNLSSKKATTRDAFIFILFLGAFIWSLIIS